MLARSMRAWGEHAAGWLGAAVETMGRPSWGEDVLHQFADILAEARASSEIETALVRLAHELSGAEHVELVRAGAPSAPRCVVRWPDPEDRDDAGPPSDLPFRLPVRCGEHLLGTLLLVPSERRPPSAATVRRLTTLCAMAAAAELGLRADRMADCTADPSGDASVRDAPFLRAFLPYALAQARRRQEPLSLLYVSVDRLAAIRELHGPELADAAVERVADTAVQALRASDVVVRLDDGRVIAVLPNADNEDAPTVAEAVRAAIAGAGIASQDMPVLTASIGVASYPHNALDIVSLNLAASAALARARGLGRDRVVQATEKAASPKLAIAQCTG